MIKIIEPGKKKYRKRCCYCQCLFSFEEEDTIHREFEDRGMSWGSEDVVTCPFCKNELHVDKTDIHIGPKEDYEFPPQTVEAISGVSPV